MKIVINKCFGGFSLSEEAAKLLDCARHDFYDHQKRNDPRLIEVVEKLGKRANGDCAELKVVTIPDDVDWEISEYDGVEHIAEKHRTWG